MKHRKNLLILLLIFTLTALLVLRMATGGWGVWAWPSHHPANVPEPVLDARGIPMAIIPAGTFQMGSTSGPSDDEMPVHTVNLSAFYMDIYEVTNAQYAQCVAVGECSVRAPSGSSYYGNPTYDNYPMLYVDWYQASEYCAWRGGRLPTEAEWEYAARGGLDGMEYPWGNKAPICRKGAVNGAKYNNLGSCDDTGTEPVGSYSPNGYGLYDMAGNAWEWVNDWYGDYPSGTVTDPSGPASGTRRVMRGGSWNLHYYTLRVTFRGSSPPDESYFVDGYGFRCAASLEK